MLPELFTLNSSSYGDVVCSKLVHFFHFNLFTDGTKIKIALVAIIKEVLNSKISMNKRSYYD